MKYKNKLKVVSLFSGCGGMDLGFVGNFNYLNKHYEENPFEIVYANDIYKNACKTYEHNFNFKPICSDINDIDKKSIPKADIVIGGFPCQDFSVAGKRKGLKSKRGRLYLQMKKVIEKTKPIAFVAENVDGIRNSKANANNSALDIIVKDFESIGYHTVYKVLNASNYGGPQNRVRVFIVGIKKEYSQTMKYPQATHGNTLPLITAKDAIDDLWDVLDKTDIPNHTIKDYSKAKFYPGKKMQGNCQISADKPSPTIRAEHHGNIEGHYKSYNEKNKEDMLSWRRLSVRECARLQSFPDNFVFPTSL